MKRIIYLLTAGLMLGSALFAGEEKTFYLKSGEIVSGSLIQGDEKLLVIRTNYGIVQLLPSDLVMDRVEIIMKNSDKLKGDLLMETETDLTILSSVGKLTIPRKDISSISYNSNTVSSRSVKFTLTNEKQVDVFYDPTGFVLDDRELYVSGLSWGFGVSPKLQVMSRWVDYFWGNFNVKAKYRLFYSGNWEKEKSLAVGAGLSTRLMNEFYEWNAGTVTTGGETRYFGAYTPIGSTVDTGSIDYYNSFVSFNEPNLQPYYEVFAAYSAGRVRGERSGRITHSFGGRVGKLKDVDKLIYRVYYGGGIDIRSNLIVNYEVFYDPYYVEWWNRNGMFNYYEAELSNAAVEKPVVSPWHFDIGFIYAYSDWLRFGIHFQPYIFAIYMKF